MPLSKQMTHLSKYKQVIQMTKSKYIKTGELAKELGVHRSTIARWAKAGLIPAERVGPKTIRVLRQESVPVEQASNATPSSNKSK
jgi:excisionase family DNA binding protein